MKPRAYLRKLRVTRVDLVPAGANPESHVVLAKAANPFAGKNPGPAAAPTLGKVRMFLSMKKLDASPAAVLAELEKPGTSKDPKVKAAAAAFSQSRLPVTATKEQTMSDTDTVPGLADLSQEDIDGIGTYVSDLAAELEAERARASAALEALAKAEEDGTLDTEDVLKGLPDAVVERITKAEAAAADAVAKADAITKAERERVFKARAAALVNLSGGDDGADRLGSVLEKAEAALDEADYAELERTLTAADTQLTKAADLFKTVGSDGDGPSGEFIDTIKARSEALVAEGMDPVEAMRKARQENPDLAADYLAARRGN